MTHISQTQDGFKAKAAGILCGFQRILTKNKDVFVEKGYIFGFSDTKKEKEGCKRWLLPPV